MSVTLVITKCGDCPYLSHSGVFTPGGARDVCGHEDSVSSFLGREPVLNGDDYHWRHRIVNRKEEPPLRCPLRGLKSLESTT